VVEVCEVLPQTGDFVFGMGAALKKGRHQAARLNLGRMKQDSAEVAGRETLDSSREV
jgi:hypothetical protein